MAVEELLHLARVDVLAPADHHVLDPAGDLHVAVVAHHREVAGVHPPVDEHLRRLLRLLPVAEHDRVPTRAELAGLPPRQRLAGDGVDDLDLEVRVHRADRADLALERVVRAGLRGHRRGLGHAVADRHLLDPGLDELGHDGCRARRAGHDAGSHRRQVPRPEVGQRPLGDEHRRHAVERRAPLLGDRVERRGGVEARRRDDRAGTVGGGREVAHDHAEAVVEGHRDADPVLLGVAAQLPHQVAVVEDVVVRERRALGEAGGARRVLDVDRVAGVEGGLHHRQALGAHLVGAGEQGVPGALPEHDDVLECGAPAPGGVDHGDVVRGLERGGDHHHPDAGLVQHVGELVRAVGRVDRHEDRPDLGGRVLGEGPLDAVRRPDADAVPLLDAGPDEGAGEPVDLRAQLGVREPDAGRPVDDRVALGEPGHRRVEVVSDRLLEERRIGGPHGVRQGRVGRLLGHRRPSGCGCGSTANTGPRPPATCAAM